MAECVATTALCQTLTQSKLEVSQFEKMRLGLQTQIDLVNQDLDLKESKLKGLESFTDRYGPLRTLI